MASNFTREYYTTHYRPIQREKFDQLWSHLAPHLSSKIPSLLDLGIGPAWFEEFLITKGISLPHVVGVDVDEKAIAPANENIVYVLDDAFDTDEKFDMVVCIDAWHLFPKLNLQKFVKKGGLLLVTLPQAFAGQLESLKEGALWSGWIGTTEKSYAVILRNNA